MNNNISAVLDHNFCHIASFSLQMVSTTRDFIFLALVEGTSTGNLLKEDKYKLIHYNGYHQYIGKYQKDNTSKL